MNPLPLAIAELRRNLPGAIAIVALIAIAAALGVSVSAQERALRQASARAADRFDLIIGAPGSPTQLVLTTVYLQPAALELLPVDTLSRLAREPGVSSIAPVAVTDSFQGYTIVGTTAAFVSQGGMLDGRMFDAEHEVVVGSAVQLELGQSLFPEHGSPAENVIESHEHHFEMRIVGRLRPTGTPWDRAIIAPIEALWSMHDEPEERAATDAASPAAGANSHRVPAVVVKPRSVNDAYALRASYRGRDTLAVFPAEVLIPLYRILGDVQAVFTWMAAAFQTLLIVAVLLVIVAVLAARRQSLGVLRALGAPPAFVFLVVWLQGALLIAAGTLGGALLAWVLSRALGAWLSVRTGLAIDSASGLQELWMLLALLVAGSLLSALPSLAALRGSADRLLRVG